jgi:quercetin dioxygenase-like cupin family protein
MLATLLFGDRETTGERGHTAPRHRHRLASGTFIVLDGEILRP